MTPCPHCDRTFTDENARFQHHRAKHRGKEARRWREQNKPDREKSMGEELADAMLAAAIGEPVPEHIAMMFPEQVAQARRRGGAA